MCGEEARARQMGRANKLVARASGRMRWHGMAWHGISVVALRREADAPPGRPLGLKDSSG
jgi:hypothetical protein